MMTRTLSFRNLDLLSLEQRLTPHSDGGIAGVLSQGHYDVFEVHYDNGQLEIKIHDHSSGKDFSPSGAVLFAKPESKQSRPTSTAFDFIGVAAGQPVWILPQTQNPNLLYAGIASETIQAGTFAVWDTKDARLTSSVGEYIRIELVEVDGPGAFSLWSNDSFGTPTAWFASADGIDAKDVVYTEVGSHDHYNWGFTAAGTYKIQVRATTFSAADPSQAITSEIVEYRFDVDELGPNLPEPTPVIPPFIVVGADAGGGPNVRVFHRETGQLLSSFFAYETTFTGGVLVAQGDLDGDGVMEIVTVPGNGGGPLVKVFDMMGNLKNAFLALDAKFRGGLTVATGDIDGDGKAEILIGTGNGGGPIIQVLTGQGKNLFGFFAYDVNFRGGVNVAAGDLDGDGKAEIVTGAGIGGGPHVRVFDAATKAELRSFFPYDSGFRNGVFVATGDVNGDGIADIITGAGVGGGPHVRAFDFKFKIEVALADFFAYDSNARGGVRVAGLPVMHDDHQGHDHNHDDDHHHHGHIITSSGPGDAVLVKIFKTESGQATEEKAFAAFEPPFLGGAWVG